MLSATTVPDFLAVPTIPGVQLDFEKRLTETFARILRLKAGVSKEEAMKALNNGCCEEIVGGRRIRKQ